MKNLIAILVLIIATFNLDAQIIYDKNGNHTKTKSADNGVVKKQKKGLNPGTHKETIAGQTLTVSDLQLLSKKNTDEVAEILIPRGFEFYENDILKQKNAIYKRGKEDISLRFDNDDPTFRYKLIMACYSKGFNQEYANLLSQIKSKGRKLSFFYSSPYKLYLTEYLIGADTYVYVCKGFCQTVDGEKENSLFVSSQSIKD